MVFRGAENISVFQARSIKPKRKADSKAAGWCAKSRGGTNLASGTLWMVLKKAGSVWVTSRKHVVFTGCLFVSKLKFREFGLWELRFRSIPETSSAGRRQSSRRLNRLELWFSLPACARSSRLLHHSESL